jgi:hypothetical protein
MPTRLGLVLRKGHPRLVISEIYQSSSTSLISLSFYVLAHGAFFAIIHNFLKSDFFNTIPVTTTVWEIVFVIIISYISKILSGIRDLAIQTNMPTKERIRGYLLLNNL